MILTAYTPAYLPWPGLFSRAAQADILVLLDTVEFSHGDITNRNRIKTQNGVQWLTVPVQGSKNQRIGDIKVCDTNWRRKHARAVELAYPGLVDGFHVPVSDQLATIGELTIRWLLEKLDIDVQIVLASGVAVHGWAGSDLLLNLCRMLDADTYLCGARGRDYLDQDAFQAAGVRVEIQDYVPRPYPQLHGEFVPGLSALDLVLNTGAEARSYL